ncbi:MAG: hypothetical protein ACUVWV_16230 [Thermodesulfobacteriota bacterium]
MDYVNIDRLNYHYADWVYRKYKLDWARTEEFFRQKGKELAELLKKEHIATFLLY